MIHKMPELLRKDIFSFNSYKNFINEVLTGKSNFYPEDKNEQIKINLHRMQRVEKQVCIDNKITERLQEIDQEQIWLLIVEPWCIDSAFSLPVIAKMASENNFIHLYIILRDQYQNLINRYLTNGARSIPKLIIFNDNIEIGTWGPRPENIKDAISKLKEENTNISKSELHAKSVYLYSQDRGIAIQQEIAHIVDPAYKPDMVLCD